MRFCFDALTTRYLWFHAEETDNRLSYDLALPIYDNKPKAPIRLKSTLMESCNSTNKSSK